MDIAEYSYSEMDQFDQDTLRNVSAHTNKRYFNKIPILPDEINERRTKMYLACKIQRLPYKASCSDSSVNCKVV